MPWRADDLELLEASCLLTPAADNPYSEHPLPLQAAQQMEARGRLGGAALAYEAAARVPPSAKYPAATWVAACAPNEKPACRQRAWSMLCAAESMLHPGADCAVMQLHACCSWLAGGAGALTGV